MVKPTVAAIAYRWAYPVVEQMVRCQPSTALDFLQADAATKHYVAMAIRGWEVEHGRAAAVLKKLSGDLFSQPRPVVLAGTWGHKFGRLGFLKRLPGRVLLRGQYDRLVSTLSDPERRRLLNQCARISPHEVEVIAHFDNPAAAAASLRNQSKIDTDLFDYAMAAVRQHRPDLDQAGLITILREFSRNDPISRWLRNVLRHATLPEPQWAGTATITPLRSVEEIRATGRELRNCLTDDEPWLSALLGYRCYYRVSGVHGPAAVSIVSDALLGKWRLEGTRGPANAILKPAAQ